MIRKSSKSMVEVEVRQAAGDSTSELHDVVNTTVLHYQAKCC